MRTLPLMVVVPGRSVAAIAGLRLVAILAVAFAALGLTRACCASRLRRS